MRKLYIVFVVFVIILAGLFIYFSLQKAPELTPREKEQAVAELLGRKAKLSDTKEKENGKYGGKYAEFSYPGNAVVYTYKDPDFAQEKGLLESFSYDLKAPRVVFNYVATKRDDFKTLDDDPSYRLRTLGSRGYKKTTVKMSNVEGIAFQKDDQENSERDLFAIHNGVLYSFVFTGSDPKELDKLAGLLLASFKFENGK